MKRSSLVLAILVSVGLGWLIRDQGGRPSAEPSRTAATEARSPGPQAGGLADRAWSGPPARPSTATVTVTDDDVPEIDGPGELTTYLEGILAAARARGEVSSDDVRRGHLAIRRLRETDGPVETSLRARKFSSDVEYLRGELAVKPTYDALSKLESKLAKESDPIARRKLLAEYRNRAGALPEVNRMRAMHRLGELSEVRSDPE